MRRAYQGVADYEDCKANVVWRIRCLYICKFFLMDIEEGGLDTSQIRVRRLGVRFGVRFGTIV